MRKIVIKIKRVTLRLNRLDEFDRKITNSERFNKYYLYNFY